MIMRFDAKNVAPRNQAPPVEEITMRALVQDRYGPAEALRSARITRPEIADHEVLVQVHAAGVDQGTWHLMTGRPNLMRAMGSASAGRRTGSPAWTSPARLVHGAGRDERGQDQGPQLPVDAAGDIAFVFAADDHSRPGGCECLPEPGQRARSREKSRSTFRARSKWPSTPRSRWSY